MRIREATAADAAAIAELHAESWRATYRGALADEYLDGPVFGERAEVWRERMSRPLANQCVLLAEENDNLLGFACALGDDREDLGALLDNLHVRPGFHGRGIGKQLFTAIARWCVANYPDSGIYLGVLEQNARARRFYEGLGSADVGGEAWDRPEANGAPVRLYAWTSDQVKGLAQTR